jgi:molybdenum cofactor cytidylyltransferase
MYELWLTDINIMDSKISGIILAAGLSTRMGEPKQLLPFGNSTIIETVIDNMLGAKLENVIVVIGHEAEKNWYAHRT